MSLKYRLFRDDTKEAFDLGEGVWIKAFPSFITFTLEPYHKTPEDLAKAIKRVHGNDVKSKNPDTYCLAVAKKIFQWCGNAEISMGSDTEVFLREARSRWQYKLTGNAYEPVEPARKPHCGKPGGEFGVGYDGGAGPLWDNVCPWCLPDAIRLLDIQIGKWEKDNVSSYPSAIRVEVSEKQAPCDFNPTEFEKVADNPENGEAS